MNPNQQKTSRKALQLCRQVELALQQILLGCADSVLQNLMIVAVSPAPHTGRLLITVAASTAADVNEPNLIVQHLNAATSFLRQELAANIHRRKVPELVFSFDVLR